MASSDVTWTFKRVWRRGNKVVFDLNLVRGTGPWLYVVGLTVEQAAVVADYFDVDTPEAIAGARVTVSASIGSDSTIGGAERMIDALIERATGPRVPSWVPSRSRGLLRSRDEWVIDLRADHSEMPWISWATRPGITLTPEDETLVDSFVHELLDWVNGELPEPGTPIRLEPFIDDQHQILVTATVIEVRTDDIRVSFDLPDRPDQVLHLKYQTTSSGRRWRCTVQEWRQRRHTVEEAEKLLGNTVRTAENAITSFWELTDTPGQRGYGWHMPVPVVWVHFPRGWVKYTGEEAQRLLQTGKPVANA